MRLRAVVAIATSVLAGCHLIAGLDETKAGAGGSSTMASSSASATGASSTGGAGAGAGGVGAAGAGGVGTGAAGPGGGGSGGSPCTDTTNDSANCGACGYACVNGRTCAGSRCLPAWQTISTASAPAPRNGHAAVAFGGKYLSLGGTLAQASVAINEAASYDPSLDSWSLAPPLVKARCGHAAVASGTSVFAFGGLPDCGIGNVLEPGLERFNGGAWTLDTTVGAPGPRYNFAAVWTGGGVFLYGGSDSSDPALVTGGFFDPAVPAWAGADCSLAGCDRSAISMFVDGNFVRVWGGAAFGNAPAGLQYDLGAKSWSAWSLPANTPTLPQHYADDGRRIYFLNAKSGACPHDVEVLTYDRMSSSWLATDTSPPPAGLLANAAAAWVGAELIAWSGNCGAGGSTVGGRYQPAGPP